MSDPLYVFVIACSLLYPDNCVQFLDAEGVGPYRTRAECEERLETVKAVAADVMLERLGGTPFSLAYGCDGLEELRRLIPDAHAGAPA